MKNFFTRTGGVLLRMSQTHWIFIGMLAGLLIGGFLPQLVPIVKPFRGLFLNGVKCIIAPLIFATVVSGLGGAGSFRQLGRMGVRAIVYFEVVTTLALVVGLVVANVMKPGAGLVIGSVVPESVAKAGATKMTLSGFIEHLLPTSIADAVVRGDVLQIVIVSTLFGLAILAIGERGRPMLAVCESLTEVMFQFTRYIMALAPLGVGAALAASIAEHGWQVMLPLLRLVGSLYLALALFVGLVLFPVCMLCGLSIGRLIRDLRGPLLLAFATTSSESAYPSALNALEKMGIPRRITSFVLPMGYSFNLDGSTLYLSLASLFVAQAAGITMSFGQQLALVGTLMLSTKGVAAVPRATIVVLSGTLALFGLPIEAIALIIAVDEFMDMARTVVNLFGNCLATAVIARWEGLPIPSVNLEASNA